MKVLWVLNSPIGPAATILNKKYAGNSGGWIQSEYDRFDKGSVSMYFLCSTTDIKNNKVIHKKNNIGELFCIQSPKISYGLKPSKTMVKQIQKIVSDIEPDVIHIWGTETCISNVVSNIKGVPKVLFIQGLIGVHKRYIGGYFKYDSFFEVLKDNSMYDLIKWKVKKVLFSNQSNYEKQTIKNSKNILQDSDFVKAYCESLGSNLNYYDRILLPNSIFSKFNWKIDFVKKYTIFTVFGSSEEKGLHQLFKAVSIIKKKYANIQILIPGNHADFKTKKLSSNEKKLKRLMFNLGIENNVVFLGKLEKEQMALLMSTSHVFVNPSCMEIHALTVREALVVGAPVISAISGTINEYIKNSENAFLYRYEEFEMLAFYIDKIFSDSFLATKLSENAVKTFEKNNINTSDLIDIYIDVINESLDEI